MYRHAPSTTRPGPAVPGRTRASPLAERVAAHPEELPLLVAELLGARVVTERLRAAGPASGGQSLDSSELRLPTPWSGHFTVVRPEDPFTPAEVAAARWLCALAGACAASVA